MHQAQCALNCDCIQWAGIELSSPYTQNFGPIELFVNKSTCWLAVCKQKHMVISCQQDASTLWTVMSIKSHLYSVNYNEHLV